MHAPENGPNTKINVLVVEDSPTQIAHLTYLLEEQGYAVTTATNGRDALASARARKPTIIVSDIMMPEMDGYALCKAVKEDAALKETPVILVTDLNSPQDVVMGLQCCADNFITKPYDPQFLLARITQSLKNKERRAELSLDAAVEVELSGTRYAITVPRHQILDLLIPTFEEAVRLNQKLREQQQQLAQEVQERAAANERLVNEMAERRRTEEERDRFFSLSLDMLCIADKDGYFKRVSPAFTKTLGWSVDELLTRPFLDFVHPGDKASTLREVEKQVVAGEAILQFENRYRHKDGSWRTLSWKSVPHPDGIMYATARDVTESKWAEEAIKKANEHLEAANKELEAFSYSVSHDLRAPLRHIDGFSELLGKYATSLDEKGRRYLKTISESAKQMGQLIDDLLQFSRIGRAEMRMTSVNLGNLIKEAMSALHREMDGRKITWAVGPLPDVYGDATLLRQVFINLLSNSVKYTRNLENARIEVGALETGAGHSSTVTNRPNPGEVVIIVRDNGAGFDPQYAHKLFGVFQRLHAAHEFEGTGIGLANVQRIVTRHGGRVWADGKVNEGATFYVALPRAGESR